MTQEEKLYQERLHRSLERCEIHLSRIHSAQRRLSEIFDIDEEKYNSFTEDDISHLDQLIYRFSKLQDEIGSNTFKFLLIGLGEDIEGKAFKDMLNRLESLKIIISVGDWMRLREIRNMMAHEYPTFVQDTIEKLNLFYNSIPALEEVYMNIVGTIKNYNL
ncbi:hypothetical protein [Plebeiibacterium marinum]|uniref:Uncharacterized protein n=1 Tax=Plebeiibacterium marinum TaxID=2992111 RepID=A0AAE3ME17_9BACT|nr:hypothetical protein [Plebeiobacterium marinum]MCW3805799.1 hypothetical protein [Plebeiobacterium marinum]